MTLELGLDTFGDVTTDDAGLPIPQAQVLRNVVEEGVLADQVGIDAFSVGEHHRPDFAISAPEVVLAAIAARTSRIRLGSAVTVLSTDDPVRVFQRFSTIHAISSGRAEVTIGRGSFTESYPLFGYDMADYEILAEEKTDLFARLVRDEVVTWSGRTRSALDRVRVYPPIEQGTLRTWVAVGGSPQSVLRAAGHGLPLMLAIIGGSPTRFLPYVQLYRKALADAGQPAQPVGVHSPGHIADTDQQAKDELWPHYRDMMNRIGRERGWGASITRAEFAASAEPLGANFAGSPAQVTDKILANHEIFGFDRFVLQMAIGVMDHAKLMKAIELYGTKVAPEVRKAVAARKAEPAGA